MTVNKAITYISVWDSNSNEAIIRATQIVILANNPLTFDTLTHPIHYQCEK